MEGQCDLYHLQQYFNGILLAFLSPKKKMKSFQTLLAILAVPNLFHEVTFIKASEYQQGLGLKWRLFQKGGGLVELYLFDAIMAVYI